MIKKFRKRIVVIEVEAARWEGTPESKSEIRAWVPADVQLYFHGGELRIPTTGGVMFANVGDWIVRGMSGELHPYKPAVFNATYEQVDEGATP